MARQRRNVTYREALNERYKYIFPEYLQNFNLISLTDVWKVTDGDAEEKKQTPYFKMNEILDSSYLAYNKLYFPDEEWKDAKKSYLQEFIKIYDKQKENYKNIYNRFVTSVNSLEKNGYYVNEIKDLQTDWHLIAGLGGESVLETSISLHPLYGFPYIPGSAVKGLARAYAVIVDKKACDKDDQKINQQSSIDEEAVNVFGNQEQAGQVIFYDAIPFENLPELKLDIMNNHYNDYYNKSVHPTDSLTLLPIYFVTVGAGQKFSFMLASKNDALLKKAVNWLEEGLKDLGAGGKTSAGYGYFIPIKATPIKEVKDSYTLAEITDLSKKPVKAKIVDSNIEFILGGINNTSGLAIGSKIFVELHIEKKTKKIQSGKFIKKA